MPDREKTIRALEGISIALDIDGHHNDAQAVRDALALLKEHGEGVAPIESTTEQKKFADRIGIAVSDFWCGKCHFNLLGHPKFCPNCGKRVKWNE